jgi:hypothetical protein
MKTLVLLVVAAFLAERCQGNRTQGKQKVLKTAKSTVEVHSACHGIYVATETGGQMAGCCVLLCAPAQDRGTHAAMHKILTTIIFLRIS